MRAFIASFGAGIWLLQQQSALPDLDRIWFLGALGATALVASVVLALRCPHSASWKAFAVSTALAIAGGVGAGFVYAALFAGHRLNEELPSAWEGVDIRVQGIVSGLPALNRSDRSTRFAFDVERVLAPVEAVVPSRISVSWYSGWRGARPSSAAKAADEPPPPEVHAGERWELVVRLRRPHGNANPHGFDLEAWMLENGLRASGYVRPDAGNRRIDAFAGRFMDRVDGLREGIRSRILAALPDKPYAGVIVALAIGDQRSVPQDQWALYNRTGVSHLLSISGLHVTLFATLVGGALFHLWRCSQRLTTRLPARKAAALLGALASFGYVLLAGFEVPAQRTLYMLIVAAIGIWIGRPGTAFTVLLWALFAVLVLDPWAVLAAGFWLSFGAVALLMYAGGGRLTPRAPSRWSWLASAARAQWAITLGLVPLMLALFQQVSLVSPLANAFAIPVVSVVVVPLALLWLVVPWDGILVAAHVIFAIVAAGLEALGEMPSAVWTQHAPPPWAVAAGVVGALLLLAPRGLWIRALGLVWLAPLFATFPERPAPGGVWLEFLDVGQGLAVVVQTHGHTLLYDTGARFSDQADAGNRIIAPYLRARGIAKLDGLIVTHADADHSGGALSLLETVPIGWLRASLPDDNAIVARRVLRGQQSIRCTAGEAWAWDGVHFDVLHPEAVSHENLKIKSNDRGCVVRIGSRHGSALLTADIEARSESELLRRVGERLASDVMLVPHHGSRTSSTEAFIDAVQPQLAIATAGYRNRFSHPRAEVVARYVDRGIRVMRSDHDGAIEIRFDGGPIKVRSFRETSQPYWRNRPERGPAPVE